MTACTRDEPSANAPTAMPARQQPRPYSHTPFAMPAFSVFNAESEPVEATASDMASPGVFGYGATSSTPILSSSKRPATTGRRSSASNDSLPRVLLRVPELTEPQAAPSTARRSAFAEILYWLVILLGSALATWLIWDGDRRRVTPVDDAPTWPAHAAPEPSFGVSPGTISLDPRASSDVTYTARHRDSGWDTAPPFVAPGEAAPLTPITTPAEP